MKRIILCINFIVIFSLLIMAQAQQEFYGVSKPTSIEIIGENILPKDFIKKY